MIPSVGRIVHYQVTSYDVGRIKRQRDPRHRTFRNTDGIIVSGEAHGHAFGNEPEVGQVFPLLITKVWGDTEESAVNGQLFLDGNDSLWLTSVCQGEGSGRWRDPRPGPAIPDSAEPAA